MGNLNRSLKLEFRNSLIKIIGLSMVLSILTFAFWWLKFNDYRFPANYYESQIPYILDEVGRLDRLDSLENREKLDELIPKEGMDYQLIDPDGSILYGSTGESLILNREEMMRNLNRHISKGKNVFIYLYPILDEAYDIELILALKYSLRTSTKVKSIWFDLFSRSLFLFPFIYISLLSFYYSKKMSKKVNKPIDLLMEAAEKVGNQDLDFEITYEEENELARLARAFENMKDKLKESLESQWKLEDLRKENLSAIAHDLKTPLTIVKTYSESLLKNAYDEKTDKYLRTIYRNNERAILLIEDINKLSSIESEDFSLNINRVNVLEEINFKMEDIKLLAEERGIDLEVKLVNKAKSPLASYDLLRVNQVIDNIFSNALNYSSGLISLEVYLEDNGFNFSIENSSDKGISKDVEKNAFEKFYRGDKSRAFKKGNSGLGLYISKTIVNAHGGTIDLRDTGGGTRLSFNIKYRS